MTQAAFYILSGDLYIAEARRSAVSIQKHMPDVSRYLFTPDAGVNKGSEFDRVITLPPRIHESWYLETVRYLDLALAELPPYLLWLDSDTCCCMPFGEFFELLDRFDLTGAHAPGRRTGPTFYPVPDCFPELNTGVIGLHNTAMLQAFVARWYAFHRQNAKLQGYNDQTSLREMLWKQSQNTPIDCFQFYVFPPEWNLRLVSPGGYFIRDKVRFLHGRGDLERWAKLVNRKKGMRVWKPR